MARFKQGWEIRQKVEKIMKQEKDDIIRIPWELLLGTFYLAFTLLCNVWNIANMIGVSEGIILTRELSVEAGDVMYVAAAAIGLGFDVVAHVFDTVGSILRDVTFGSVHLPYIPEVNIFTGGWLDALRNVEKDCVHFTTWQDEIGFIFRQTTKNNLCAFLRYVSPVGWLYDIFDGLLGWASYDPLPSGKSGHCIKSMGYAKLVKYYLFYIL